MSTLFSHKNCFPSWRTDSRPYEAPNSIFIYAKEGQNSSAQPFTFVDDFPDQTGCDFLTSYRSSALYTVKLEPGIFVIRVDFRTGQLVSKFGLVTSVYRKIWTIVYQFVEFLVDVEKMLPVRWVFGQKLPWVVDFGELFFPWVFSKVVKKKPALGVTTGNAKLATLEKVVLAYPTLFSNRAK